GHGVCHDAIYTRDGNIYTSAGVTAGMDMALAMLEEDHGNAVALAVARELVLFLKRPGGQSQFSDYLAAQFSEDAGVRELQLWMLEHLDKDLSVPRLAERIAMSERSFARHFADGVGLAPGHYVRQIRLTAARQKLEQTDLPLQQIARRCGFGTPESLRRSFIASLGVTPGAYRARLRGAVDVPERPDGQAPGRRRHAERGRHGERGLLGGVAARWRGWVLARELQAREPCDALVHGRRRGLVDPVRPRKVREVDEQQRQEHIPHDAHSKSTR